MKSGKRSVRSSKSAVSVPRDRHPLWLGLLAISEAMLILLLVVGIAVALYFAYQRLTKQAFFPLRRVIIAEPLRYGSADDVAAAVNRAGEPDLMHVDVQELAKNISDISWVSDAVVEKRWPDSVYVRLQERFPVVRWGGQYLDKDAVRFSLPNPPAQEALFPVMGPDGYEGKVLARYREMEPWLLGQQVPMNGIRLDPRLIWHIDLPGDIDVILGRDDLNNRLKKLAMVYKRVVVPYEAYIDAVDLRYQDGFSVRWKPGVKPKNGQEAAL
ncbi:cell division protein FtsQ/DivIB [Cardiobacteriaceae bacterium TAE3-ERU3]|nr:cell division protein FtsQ/DivIB [Cardiobacteriaceae bacterium TAE3-ERU3]